MGEKVIQNSINVTSNVPFQYKPGEHTFTQFNYSKHVTLKLLVFLSLQQN
jgi:hypothetical protein